MRRRPRASDSPRSPESTPINSRLTLPILLSILSLLTALLSGTLHETRLVDFKFHHAD